MAAHRNAQMSAAKKPNVYARAARLMELDEELYPCWAICLVEGKNHSEWPTNDSCKRFVAAFSNRYTYKEKSSHFLREMEWTIEWPSKPPFRDNSIVALCFVAAMEDAGDLP